jgi:hypothetical protein
MQILTSLFFLQVQFTNGRTPSNQKSAGANFVLAKVRNFAIIAVQHFQTVLAPPSATISLNN